MDAISLSQKDFPVAKAMVTAQHSVSRVREGCARLAFEIIHAWGGTGVAAAGRAYGGGLQRKVYTAREAGQMRSKNDGHAK